MMVCDRASLSGFRLSAIAWALAWLIYSHQALGWQSEASGRVQIEAESHSKQPLGIYTLLSTRLRNDPPQTDFMQTESAWYSEWSMDLKIENRNDHAFAVDDLLYQGGVQVGKQGQFSLFLGRKVVVWGKGDVYNPVDLIAGEDFSRFLSYDKDRRKRSRDMLLLTLSMGVAEWTAIVMQGTGSHSFADQDSPWCLGECRRLAIERLSEGMSQRGIATQIEEYRQRSKRIYEAALRLNTRFPGWDLGVYYFHIAQRNPAYSRRLSLGPQSAPEILLERSHQTRPVFGLDAAWTMGRFGFRSEAILKKDQLFMIDPTSEAYQTDDDGLVARDQWEASLGFDLTVLTDLYHNIQYGRREIPEDLKNLLIAKGGEFVSWLIRKPWSSDLNLELLSLLDGQQKSVLLRPQATWRWDDTWSWEAGGVLFGGPADSFLGAYRPRSHFYTRLIAEF